MAFRGLTADPRPLEEFRARAPRASASKSDDAVHNIPLHVFKWVEGASTGLELSDVISVEELSSRCQGAVRVIFAPREVPVPDTVDGFCDLFKKHGIPSAFIDESLQDVSQSFAAQRDTDGTVYVWFHFLCKDIAVANDRIVHVQDPRDRTNHQEQTRLAAQQQSQANFTWLKPGFVLKIRRQETPAVIPTRTHSSTSDSTLTAPSTQAQIELFCFGATVTLRDRFQNLINVATCEDLLKDPYILLEIVLTELHKFMDRTGWTIADLFGVIETQTLGMASRPGKAAKELLNDHFTGLHNLAKHTIYLRENCEAALATLGALQKSHKAAIGDQPTVSQELTRQALEYRKTLFQSTQRRLTSLDARMTNIIQLSFHIVTQGDSRVMQSENQSMKTIAVMTLIFMPLGTVAGIFGTQFMKLQDEKPFHMTVSQDFWLMWLIAIPLTIIVVIIWRVWYMDARGRLIDEIPPRADGEHGYMGWKTLQLRGLRRRGRTTHSSPT